MISKQPLFGTTIIYIVTPEGIVLAADSITIGPNAAPSGTAIKLVTIGNRFAIATAWICAFDNTIHTVDKTMDGWRPGPVYELKYSFEPWIRSIGKDLPSDVTLTRVSEIIEKEAASTFRDVGILLEAGTLKYDEARGDVLVRYYVAGYENRLPMIYQIQLKGDWNAKRAIGPQRSLLHPKGNCDPDFGFNVGGAHSAIDQVLQRNGEPYQTALDGVPKELGKLLGGQNLTPHEAVDLAVCLIRIEAKYNPDKVSPPVRVATITPNGVARSSEYR